MVQMGTFFYFLVLILALWYSKHENGLEKERTKLMVWFGSPGIKTFYTYLEPGWIIFQANFALNS